MKNYNGTLKTYMCEKTIMGIKAQAVAGSTYQAQDGTWRHTGSYGTACFSTEEAAVKDLAFCNYVKVEALTLMD